MEEFIGRFSPLEFVLVVNGAVLALYVALVVLFSLLPVRVRFTVIERERRKDEP